MGLCEPNSVLTEVRLDKRAAIGAAQLAALAEHLRRNSIMLWNNCSAPFRCSPASSKAFTSDSISWVRPRYSRHVNRCSWTYARESADGAKPRPA